MTSTRDGGFRLDRVGSVWIVRSVDLLDIPGLGHAFSTRRGSDGDEFDVGTHAEASPAAENRRAAVLCAAGLDGQRAVRIRQVHGSRVVDSANLIAEEPAEADAVVSERGVPSQVAAVRWADCVPVLLADREGRVAAAIHSGWRGVVAGVTERTVARLRTLGHEPGDLVAALGPCIGPCCYEVGEDVIRAVALACGVERGEVAPGPAVRSAIDLRRAVEIQLRRAGLASRAVHQAPWCTACSGEWFHSHRRDGGAAGRQLACVGWIA